ncbi:hypothetical protein HYALB_00003419 [Hymenoscyphus albidus]|uniref:RRM domain-containing protein n=1 Tax=Hymenoscyphus albidus TaxID=595503 RepID=A0A9N9Q0H9_9HELO|nr:hypothetical protein HYALB_00003419 [Hymenoscyphus albidus]
MSGKLDQSLDEILSSTNRRSSVRGGAKGSAVTRRSRRNAKPTVAPPVGGVKKPQRGGKTGAKAIPTGPSGLSGESKILVSNLPKDVTEAMVKEYFVKSVGPVKKVEVSYGPGGVSRGIATIFFARPDSATKALETLSGVLVDGRSMKIDIILDARRAAAIPPTKGLGERITQPKSQPKSAAVTKGTTAARGKAARGRGGKTTKNARPAKKTAEELDSEMADYFGGANTEAAQPAANGTNGDAAMDDEIL